MKIADFRKALEKLPPSDLQRLAAELYRLLPKKTRESIDIAGLLEKPGGGSRQKTAAPPDIDSLQSEIDEFLIDAYAQNYLAPNRSVPKSQRSKWRFKAKRYFNDLLAAAANPENTEGAATLMESLYAMLCHACDYALFNAFDPFDSVGIPQTEFLETILALKKKSLEPANFISEGLELVRDSRLNHSTLGSDLVRVFLEHLSMPEILEAAIARAAELHSEVTEQTGEKLDFKEKDQLDRMAELGFHAYAKLGDFDKAIGFLAARLAHKEPEMRLYLALKWLETAGRKDLWLREYERAVESGIEPRDSLRESYRNLREHDAFQATA